MRNKHIIIPPAEKVAASFLAVYGSNFEDLDNGGDSEDEGKRTSTIQQSATLKPAPTLDFFGAAVKHTAPQNTDSEKKKTPKENGASAKKQSKKRSVESVESEEEEKTKKPSSKKAKVEQESESEKEEKKVVDGQGKKKKKGAKDEEQIQGSEVQLFSQPNSEEEEGSDEGAEERSQEEIHKAEMATVRKARRIHVHGTDIADPVTSFDELQSKYGVHPSYIRNMQAAGYSAPTPIQMQAIPLMIKEREVLGCAPTGSGKTMAFLLPILHHLKEPKRAGFRAVILSPTKELARQIYNECEKLARGQRFLIHHLTKATASKNSFGPQSNHKYDIMIATPLRLCWLIKECSVPLNNVQWLVFDEADKLWEMGFITQMDEIISACTHPKLCKALFSATLPPNVEEMAKSTLKDPVNVTVGEKNAATETIKQRLTFVGREDGKLLAVRQLIQEGVQPPVLIFVQSVERAKQLFHELIYDGVNVDVIHSERTQAQRDLVVKKFRLGEIWVLIATDLLGRGMDFKGVNLVINYDFPQSPADYIHRIGRTGRAGREGEAVTFFTHADRVNLRSIANVMKESGCEVPDWMLEIPKPNKNKLRQLRKKPISRKPITTASKYDIQKSKEKGGKRGKQTKSKKEGSAAPAAAEE